MDLSSRVKEALPRSPGRTGVTARRYGPGGGDLGLQGLRGAGRGGPHLFSGLNIRLSPGSSHCPQTWDQRKGRLVPGPDLRLEMEGMLLTMPPWGSPNSWALAGSSLQQRRAPSSGAAHSLGTSSPNAHPRTRPTGDVKRDRVWKDRSWTPKGN